MQGETETPFLTLVFQHDDRSTVVLRDANEATDWINAEMSFWSWITEAHPPEDMNQIVKIWWRTLTQFRDVLSQYRTAAADTRASLRGSVEAHANNVIARTLPSISSKAQFAEQLRTGTGGPMEALAALAAFTDWNHFNDKGARANHDKRFLGYAKAARFIEGAEPKALQASKGALDKILKDALAHTELKSSEVSELIKTASNSASKFEIDSSELLKGVHTSATENFSNANEKFDKLQDDLLTVKKTYEEHMALKSPVQYWQDRATVHRLRIWLFTSVLALAIGAAVWALYKLFSWLEGKFTASLNVDHFFYAGLGVLATTVAFWVIRVILKIVLSERHLRNNAEEKSMLLKTYLAMTSVSEATREDRQIVLASVFSTSSDGIVKDDGGPDLSLAAFLSRFLVK